MNPKFRDLQIQAFAECKTFEDGQFRTDELFERFALLIVRECIDLCEIWNVTPGSRLAEEIKKQFGVE